MTFFLFRFSYCVLDSECFTVKYQRYIRVSAIISLELIGNILLIVRSSVAHNTVADWVSSLSLPRQRMSPIYSFHRLIRVIWDSWVNIIDDAMTSLLRPADWEYRGCTYAGIQNLNSTKKIIDSSVHRFTCVWRVLHSMSAVHIFDLRLCVR